jgi:hypothetical protein
MFEDNQVHCTSAIAMRRSSDFALNWGQPALLFASPVADAVVTPSANESLLVSGSTTAAIAPF